MFNISSSSTRQNPINHNSSLDSQRPHVENIILQDLPILDKIEQLRKSQKYSSFLETLNTNDKVSNEQICDTLHEITNELKKIKDDIREPIIYSEKEMCESLSKIFHNLSNLNYSSYFDTIYFRYSDMTDILLPLLNIARDNFDILKKDEFYTTISNAKLCPLKVQELLKSRKKEISKIALISDIKKQKKELTTLIVINILNAIVLLNSFYSFYFSNIKRNDYLLFFTAIATCIYATLSTTNKFKPAITEILENYPKARNANLSLLNFEKHLNIIQACDEEIYNTLIPYQTLSKINIDLKLDQATDIEIYKNKYSEILYELYITLKCVKLISLESEKIKKEYINNINSYAT